MKLLFVSLRDVNRKNSGGEKCTNRNYLSFCKLLGRENVEVLNVSGMNQDEGCLAGWTRRLDLFCGFYAGLSRKITRMIISKSGDFDFVFIDVSYLGIISYYLKKSGYKGQVITFFHNVELRVMKEKTLHHPLNFWKLGLIRYNERQAVKYSDRLIALTGRDAGDLERIYHATGCDIIPISLADELAQADTGSTGVPLSLLFVGDNWYANIHGLKWFIRHVLDEVNVKLIVAGRNLDSQRKLFIHPRIEFQGFVEDLAPLLNRADYILCPLFRGGGMKVKICEALMYGKNIIGTTEAFEGYRFDAGKVGALCNTREEFIGVIRKFGTVSRNRFNPYSRDFYLNYHSFGSTLDLFRMVINPLQKRQ